MIWSIENRKTFCYFVQLYYYTSIDEDKHFSTQKLIGKYHISKSRGRLVVTLFRLLMFCS